MALPTLSLSGASAPPASGFGAYHDLYAIGSQVTQANAHFSASVKAYRLNRLLVFERHLDGVSHSRDVARIRRDGFDHVTLHLLLSGTLTSGPIGAERRMKPGEWIILDSSVPQRSRSHGSHTFSLSLARDQIGPIIPDLRRFHGTILSASDGGLLADLIQSFIRRRETLSAETAGQFSHIVGTLLAAALKGTEAQPDEILGMPAFDQGRRERAEAFIEAHLGDQRLDAGAIAAGIGVSRTVLYRCFAEDGGVARYLQQRRLERIRTVLRKRSDGLRLGSIADAHGFASEQHMNRAFRASFGQPPGQFRSMIERMRRADAADPTRPDSLTSWLVELY